MLGLRGCVDKNMLCLGIQYFVVGDRNRVHGLLSDRNLQPWRAYCIQLSLEYVECILCPSSSPLDILGEALNLKYLTYLLCRI